MFDLNRHRFCHQALLKGGASLLMLFSLSAFSASVRSVEDEQLVDADVDELEQFVLVDDTTKALEQAIDHTLVQSRTFDFEGRRYVRYQQYYQGLEVDGRTVIGHYQQDDQLWNHDDGRFFGKITNAINLQIPEDYLTDSFRQTMAEFAQGDFRTRLNVQGDVNSIDTQPVIWVDKNEQARLAYRVNFRVQPDTGPIRWPHYLIAAHDSKVLQFWDNVQSATSVPLHKDQAPGGNGKTGQYTFGTSNLPVFSVTQAGSQCQLSNSKVKVVSLNGGWWIASNPTPYTYTCGENVGDPVNGGWSPENDAYVFANLVVSMYKSWYQTSVLTLANGQPRQLLVLVNVGNRYENAFWDGRYLAFGDGHQSFYPLVSVTIVAHELSHAFTNEHSNLIYANQSGAINEAFSDMAAIAAEAYLKSNHTPAYQSLIGVNGIDWRIGDRITKGNFAMRSMSNPAAYGSAACETRLSGCSRSWSDVVKTAEQIPLASRQSYIVHKGSGVMNRAFYNIVNSLNGDVRKAFALMVRANMLYWTPSSNFAEAACGVKQAASSLSVNATIINNAFQQVGVTPSC